MSIQPLSNRPREISVTEIIEPAFERVKLVLFRPFDFAKWIVIGFCAWLAGLGESGGGGFNFPGNSFNTPNSHNNNNTPPGDQFREFYHKASDFITANLAWIIPLTLFVFLIVLAIVLVVLWLNSRGKFMLVHCVALNKGEVDVPWHKYAGAANSLFWFRVVIWLASMVLMLPLVIFIAVAIIRMVMQGEPDVGNVMLAVLLGMVMIVFGIIFALIHKFTTDFVVPIMYLRGSSCLTAWREFLRLLTGRPGHFVLYILFQIVIGIAIAAIVFGAMVVTCCIAACFLAIPFIGTVLLLPILVFKRSYSLYYLAQFGPQYDVFPPPPAPAPAPPPQPGATIGPISPINP